MIEQNTFQELTAQGDWFENNVYHILCDYFKRVDPNSYIVCLARNKTHSEMKDDDQIIGGPEATNCWRPDLAVKLADFMIVSENNPPIVIDAKSKKQGFRQGYGAFERYKLRGYMNHCKLFHANELRVVFFDGETGKVYLTQKPHEHHLVQTPTLMQIYSDDDVAWHRDDMICIGELN